ncbi:MAG: type II secretion system F family protein [Anaerolineales bacterium]|nr:type II secretion system F family protein [Anaerolineales bacterium]MCB8952361.1 type II secretion system F family protein [Ardenticatenales bacterium]
MSPYLLIILGLGALMLFGAGIGLLAGGGSSVDERLEEFVGSPTALAMPEAPSVSRRKEGAGDRFDNVLASRGFGAKIRDRISRADVKLHVHEYILLQIGVCIGLGFLSYSFFGDSLILGIAGAIIGLRVPRLYLSFKASSRLVAFDKQLSDTLNLWVNSLRSGYSVLLAMETIATELPPPVSREFERVVQEVRLGLSLPQALNNMLRRVPSDDLDLVVTAVNIQREVGGNLAEILDIISFTIRERVRIKGEIRTLTAQGRVSGWIVGLLPLFLTLILYRLNPTYMGELWVMERPFILTNVLPCGWLVIASGLLMILAGVAVIRKIVNIEV